MISVMFKHLMIQADDLGGLGTILGLDPNGIRVVRHKRFPTRIEALDYLHLKLGLLEEVPAIAVSVLLPTSQEYHSVYREFDKLNKTLLTRPLSWNASRYRTEKRLVDLNAKLSRMESETKEGQLYWLVYRRDGDEQTHTDRSQLQLAG